ncbi:type II toxin-antitoxin system RelE/ParE family toxin [Frankia sp. Cr2]|uniref:type II toxin-antitoxin system RelE family toxin n=1 Tax=Frankia sp. Cr2 TaxID=3073932 RepID=UPI002AD31B18|nr:type II toxin-antitoxin system RelE/ParE family toxin [Frankia sp. Cr2]
MRYTVSVAPHALRQLRRLGPTARRRVQAVIDLLAEDPRPPAARQLVGGAGEWRVRTGDYRIVYDIQDKGLIVLVVLVVLDVAVGHRRDVYR